MHGNGEPPTEVAIAAYLCADAFVGRAAPEPCSIDVEISVPGVRLLASCASGDLSGALADGTLDRVGALGGAVTSSKYGPDWSTDVWLPCES
jgi:hypothetical protein